MKLSNPSNISFSQRHGCHSGPSSFRLVGKFVKELRVSRKTEKSKEKSSAAALAMSTNSTRGNKFSTCQLARVPMFVARAHDDRTCTSFRQTSKLRRSVEQSQYDSRPTLSKSTRNDLWMESARASITHRFEVVRPDVPRFQARTSWAGRGVVDCVVSTPTLGRWPLIIVLYTENAKTAFANAVDSKGAFRP
ncbi:hypothetical protein SCHPADRAFT_896436 [Schizopora paradoxa]|uniref:Uncharacterized protein n=1 Tax=Schizopora paradoxa TaxID=27342 RepID=A0A0H2R0B2_9AGAM|nr:hypothetical protein SCHPADRAFT_896436 [Schizopora paradoxa]